MLDDKNWIFRSFLLVAQLEPDLIPRRLKEARKECGRQMTQERVADLLGVHKRTVENDENAISHGVWERLNQYAGLYNKPVEYFLWGDGAEVATADGPLSGRLEEVEAAVGLLGETVTEAMAGVANRLERIERRLASGASRPTRRKTAKE